MSKHAPGPWEVQGRDERGIWIGARHQDGLMKGFGFSVACAAMPLIGDKIDSTEANARLITAAPDLLRGASLALRTIGDTLRHVTMRDGEREALEQASTDLRAAIAKAQGKD